jgi:hypothetical protein
MERAALPYVVERDTLGEELSSRAHAMLRS